MSRRRRRQPFVLLYLWFLDCAAWHDLDPNARAAYVALKRRYNGCNNGLISFSAREAGDALNLSHHTGNRALGSLCSHGFIEIAEDSNFNRKTKTARTYLLTELPDDRPGMPKAPLRTFENWARNQKSVSLVKSSVAPVRAKRRSAP